jgi:hypothetical protein
MLTSNDIRAARRLVHVPRERLAKEAGVNLNTWSRAESYEDRPPRVHMRTVERIQWVLEKYGARFVPGGVTLAPGTVIPVDQHVAA